MGEQQKIEHRKNNIEGDRSRLFPGKSTKFRVFPLNLQVYFSTVEPQFFLYC